MPLDDKKSVLARTTIIGTVSSTAHLGIVSTAAPHVLSDDSFGNDNDVEFVHRITSFLLCMGLAFLYVTSKRAFSGTTQLRMILAATGHVLSHGSLGNNDNVEFVHGISSFPLND